MRLEVVPPRNTNERELNEGTLKHVHLTKIAGTAAVVILVAAAIAAQISHERPQPAVSSASEPKPMKDFKKPDAAELKKKLSDDQFAVTQQCGTEPPFHNAYFDNHQAVRRRGVGRTAL
jgi:hypothetical protein